jgi:1-acyl-sn-glycerol-3-phosphate acyltransferase
MTGGPNHKAPHAPTSDAPAASPHTPPDLPASIGPSATPDTEPGPPTSPEPSLDPGDPAGPPTSPDPALDSGDPAGPPLAPGSSAVPSDPVGPSPTRSDPGGPSARQPLPGKQDVVGATAAGDSEGSVEARGRAGRGAKDPERGYRLAALVVKPLMRTWFRIRLGGEEHIPEVGPVILASNHRSNMDPVLLASAVRRPVAFMAKAELFVGPLGWIMRWIGQFPVRRGGIDREALRRTDAVLARGSMLGLFPEGTRGDGRFASVHPGLAYIVVRQQCPVVPVAIFGTERVRRRFGWLPFASPVRIVVGPEIDLPQSTGDRAGRRAASELLQKRLQEFLAVAGGTPVAQSTSSQSDE